MTVSEILQTRMMNHRLGGASLSSVEELVHWMGAMQCQDYAMAKWAIGLRLPSETNSSIERAIDSGEIIRTHILRPTWHFVSSKDVRWMMELTSPVLKKLSSSMNRQLGLTDQIFQQTNKIIAKLFAKEGNLTREEVMAHIHKAGIKTNDLVASHIMFRAELDMIVCNGSRKGKQFTYDLFDRKISAGKPLKREAALAKLADRYFSSHGPATLKDFIWWGGLSVTEAKLGLDNSKHALEGFRVKEIEYWYKESSDKPTKTPCVLLPGFDEFIIGYADRSAFLDGAFSAKVLLANGIFKPTLLVNGKVAGIWKRVEKTKVVDLEVSGFKPLSAGLTNAISKEGSRYKKFMEREIILTVS